MTEQEACKRLRERCHTGDREVDHSYADMILCDFIRDLGYFDLIEEWERVEKWYA